MTIDPAYLRPRLLHRENESHKGDYGHLLIVAGCASMPGAAVLATGAALHAGCGLVTLHATGRALLAAAANFPSAMLSEDPGACFSSLPETLDRYTAIAVGPGLGRAPETKAALLRLLAAAKEKGIPTVLDADALNLLSEEKDWETRIPGGSVLTPHAGEFRRLAAGRPLTEETARSIARRSGAVLVLKGFHTRILSPEGDFLVNTTGNPGLAKGGSGDVLTGLVGGLAARGYSALDAAALGVWVHGAAADALSAERTPEAYDSRDLADALWQGFKALYTEA